MTTPLPKIRKIYELIKAGWHTNGELFTQECLEAAVVDYETSKTHGWVFVEPDIKVGAIGGYIEKLVMAGDCVLAHVVLNEPPLPGLELAVSGVIVTAVALPEGRKVTKFQIRDALLTPCKIQMVP